MKAKEDPAVVVIDSKLPKIDLIILSSFLFCMSLNENKKDEHTTKYLPKIEREHSILRSAIQVFLEKGVARTTMKDIAEREQLSEAAIYKYFNNKGAIFEKLAEEALIIVKSFWTEIEEKQKEYSLDIRSAMIKITNKIFQIFLDSRPFFQLIMKEYTDPHLKVMLQNRDEHIYPITVLEKIFKLAQKQQQLRDGVNCKSLAYLYLDMHKLILHELGFYEPTYMYEKDKLDEMVIVYVELLLNGAKNH